MKIFKKILLWTICVSILTVFAAVAAFKIFLPEEKIKSYIIDYAQTALNREVAFDKVSFNLIGLNLENFSVSEKPAFKNGTFVKADKLIVKIAVTPLLRGNIRINNLGAENMYVQIAKDKNGKFNFEDIAHNEKSQNENKTKDSGENGVKINIDDFHIKNSVLKFDDEKAKISAEITNFNMDLHNFSFSDAFGCETSFEIKYRDDKLNLSVPLNVKFETDLNDFDFDKMTLKILSLQTKYNDSDIAVSGRLENFNTPKINCVISAKNINDKTFNDFFKTGFKFNIPSLDLKLQSDINLTKKTADIGKISLILPQSAAEISGNFDWSGKDISYNLKTDADISLDGVPFARDYGLTGKIKSKAFITRNLFDGNIDFENVSCSDKRCGNISSLTAKIFLKAENKIPFSKIDFKNFSIDKFSVKITSLTANYNDASVSLTASADQAKNSSLKLKFQSKNLSNDTISRFCGSKIKFMIPVLDIDADMNFNLKTKNANISKFTVKLPESAGSLTGNINWSGKKFVYNLYADADLLLDNFAKSLMEQDLKGRVRSKIKISDRDFNGSLTLKDVSFDYDGLGSVTNLNFKAEAKSKNNIIIENADGAFNGGSFSASGSYSGDDINLKFTMDKLTFKKSDNADDPVEENAKNEKKQSKTKKFNVNLYSDIVIDKIDIPYITGQKVVLKTSLESVSNDCTKTNGYSNLSVSNGKITNVSKLAENKFARLFLLIFNVLNNNIPTSNKVNGNEKGIVYENIVCDLLFTNGLMQAKQVFVKLPLTTITTTGSANFNTGAINMKVNTGLYATMKISGTLEKPKTYFDLAGTAVEILTDSKGKIEDIGKKLGSSLINLFNKK